MTEYNYIYIYIYIYYIQTDLLVILQENTCKYNYCLLETGGIMITPRPGPSNSIPKPGFPMIPFFGIEPVLMTEDVSLYC